MRSPGRKRSSYAITQGPHSPCLPPDAPRRLLHDATRWTAADCPEAQHPTAGMRMKRSALRGKPQTARWHRRCIDASRRILKAGPRHPAHTAIPSSRTVCKTVAHRAGCPGRPRRGRSAVHPGQRKAARRRRRRQLLCSERWHLHGASPPQRPPPPCHAASQRFTAKCALSLQAPTGGRADGCERHHLPSEQLKLTPAQARTTTLTTRAWPGQTPKQQSLFPHSETASA